jgi:uncharacterized protein (DUF2461 family)
MPTKTKKVTGSGGRISAETFRFFRDLDRNNRTEWMNENRERYRSAVVQPFRGLLEELTPVVLKLDPQFDVGGRTGVNFSRINRDIRSPRTRRLTGRRCTCCFPRKAGRTAGPANSTWAPAKMW